jgi:two-component system LytT family response regulator
MESTMRGMRTLIVDDEPAAREGLRHLLAADPEIEVVGECRDGKTATAAIRDQAPELVFLDVQMPELDGLGVLRDVPPERRPVVVFVTGYDRYALQAFEVHAVEYLLKPFTWAARWRRSPVAAPWRSPNGRPRPQGIARAWW